MPQPFKPPHKIGIVRWGRVKDAFLDGGYVSTTECDAYLILESGTTQQAVDEGKIKFVNRTWGTGHRVFVYSFDAEDLLGIRRDRKRRA